MQNQRSINNEFQYNATQDLILISNNFFYIRVIKIFVCVTKAWKYCKYSLAFFWPLNNQHNLFLASF